MPGQMALSAPARAAQAISRAGESPAALGVVLMTTEPNRPPLWRLAKASVALEVLLSIGALGGGLVLIMAPRGEIMPLPVSALAGSPFDTYLGPGLILFTVLGIGPMVAARLAWLRHPIGPLAAFVVGTALLLWVAVEIAIIGYSNEPPLQAIYLVLGVAITVVALSWLAQTGRPHPFRSIEEV
jgi:hypothetical protein